MMTMIPFVLTKWYFGNRGAPDMSRTFAHHIEVSIAADQDEDEEVKLENSDTQNFRILMMNKLFESINSKPLMKRCSSLRMKLN